MAGRASMHQLLVFVAASCVFAVPAEKDDQSSGHANELFSMLQERVFQIRVIDKSSGKKSTIGSGFLIGADGLFATNYHVVSDMVIEPGRYRLEYVAHDNRTGPLSVLDIDVVHDLAIVACDSMYSSFFTLNQNKLQKGSRIFSIGNPLDLGMTIIEGTYSGLIERSLYEKIHFSGSLNPGMSGGPAIDAAGSVIGVNVSTAGQEISFLVPARHLQALIDSVRGRMRTDSVDFSKRIETQLFENQRHYIKALLEKEWKQDTLGNVLVPREMGSIFKCWGESRNDSDMLYTVSSVYCANDDDIYLSAELTTGSIEFNYHWYETEKLGQHRFYHMLQEQFANFHVPNYAGKKELEEPACATEFVAAGSAEWKTTMCSWRYKKYRRLHDVVLKIALVNNRSKSMVIDLTLLGVSREMAIAFCKRFMGALQWRD
ncbi:MAG: trypsin-like peptidase domain-containing protein [Chitinispirillaceae bacterium]|nr:trypsin-like peptidase domain-containing protein [Chitinispirillaceae bacterium]